MKKITKIIVACLVLLSVVGVTAWQYHKWANRDNLSSAVFWKSLTREKALQAGAITYGQITHGGLGSNTFKNFTLKINAHYEVRFSGSPSWGSNRSAFAEIAPLSKNPDQPTDWLFIVTLNKNQLGSDITGLESSQTELSKLQAKQLVAKAQEKLNDFLKKWRQI